MRVWVRLLLLSCAIAQGACSSLDRGALDPPPTDEGGDAAIDHGPDAATDAGRMDAGAPRDAGDAGDGAADASADASDPGSAACRPNPDLDDAVCREICPERCNGEDEDCDRRIDEGDPEALCTGLPSVQAAACDDHRCRITDCKDGTADCNRDGKDGCEVQLLKDDKHCGACGHKCDIAHGSAACGAGECLVTSCDAQWDDCDDTKRTCATSLTTLGNCGECGATCSGLFNATATCSTGTCEVASCLGPYGDCDDDVSTGCEMLLNVITDCGACDNDCAALPGVASATCTGFQCVIQSCAANTQDCDKDPTNGCELDLLTELCPYQQTLTIDNSHGKALTNHQVRLVLDSWVPSTPQAGCTYATFEGHGYYFCLTPSTLLTWSAAAASCRAVGMELMRVDSAAENDFLVANGLDHWVWIGGTDQDATGGPGEGAWAWPGGEGGYFWNGTATGNTTCADRSACTHGVDGGLYSNWGAGEPWSAVGNEDCILAWTDPGDWLARDCAQSFRYVCEVDLGDVVSDFWTHVAFNGDDVRVHDGDGMPLSYWFETWNGAGQKAVIWIEVPSIPAYSTKDLLLRYGAGVAAASDIATTMVWGDDFSSGSFSPSWNTTTADTASLWSISGGVLKSVGTGTATTGRLRSAKSFSGTSPFVAETKFQVHASATNGMAILGTWLSAANNVGLNRTGSNPTPADNYFDDGAVYPTGGGTPLTTDARASMNVPGKGVVSFTTRAASTGGAVYYAARTGNTVLAEPLALGRRFEDNVSFDNQAADVRWDWVLVRKYASPEPQVFINDDESGGPP